MIPKRITTERFLRPTWTTAFADRGSMPPVLVIHGAHDTDRARARQVAQLAPPGRWAEFEHSAHSPWLAEPSALRELPRGFVRELTHSASGGA